MSVSTSAISSLRHRTGVSISTCKDALEEANGDEDKAIELLRKRGVVQAAKKSGRDQSEGCIFLAEKEGKAALVLLKCETDFVARDDNFSSTGQNIAKCLLSDGKDAACKRVVALLPDIIQKLGENISFEKESHIIEAPIVGAYVHTNGKIAVIIGLDKGTTRQAKDIAMHAAAMNPTFISPEDIPEEEVEKEKEIWKEQLAKEGKPPQIMEKIMIGKEKKFREENALLKQEFVKEPGQTVEKYLGDAKVVEYVRMEIGS